MATTVEVEYRTLPERRTMTKTITLSDSLVGAIAVYRELTGLDVKMASADKWLGHFTNKKGLRLEETKPKIELIKLNIQGSSVTIGGKADDGTPQNFQDSDSLREVTINARNCEINDHAFCLCKSLVSVVMPDCVTCIGDNAFLGCGSLENLRLPAGLRSIGREAFSGCKSLGAIMLPDGVTSIGKGAFESCELELVYIPCTVSSIGQRAFVSGLGGRARHPHFFVYGTDAGGARTLAESLNSEGKESTLYLKERIQLLLQSRDIDVSCREEAVLVAETAPIAGGISGSNDFADDADSLWKYLRVVSEAETAVFQLTEALALATTTKARIHSILDSRRKLNQLTASLRREWQQAEAERQREAYEREKAAIVAGEYLNSHEIGMAPTNPESYPKPKKPEAPTLEKPGLFNRRKVETRNAELESRYQETLSEYERKLSERRQAIKEYRESLAAWQKKRGEAIQRQLDDLGPFEVRASYSHADELDDASQEIEAAVIASDAMYEELKQQLTDASGLLKLAYSADIIFPKYRNIEAMSTIYEYFETGRCSTLRGPNGAYNLYESELRSNAIIGKLDVVSGKLDVISDQLSAIQANQYVLYRAVKEIGTRLDAISDTLGSVLEETKRTARTTQELSAKATALVRSSSEVAYWTRKNAELTDSLGYLIAFTSL